MDSFLISFTIVGDCTKKRRVNAIMGVIENRTIGRGASSSDRGKARIVNALARNWVTPNANAKNKGGKYSEVI